MGNQCYYVYISFKKGKTIIMTNSNKPLLWEDGMSYQDYKIRQAFYNGTAQPRSTPISRPPDGEEVMDRINYPMFDEYETDYSQGLCLALTYYEDVSYKFCDDSLLEYSLIGLESLDI